MMIPRMIKPMMVMILVIENLSKHRERRNEEHRLHEREGVPELGLAVRANAEEVKGTNDDEEDGDPHGGTDALGSRPVVAVQAIASAPRVDDEVCVKRRRQLT